MQSFRISPGSAPSRFPLGRLPYCYGLISLPLRNRFWCCHTAPVRACLASLHDRSARHFLRAAVSWSPSTPAAPGMFEWVEVGIAAPSAHCNVASPIRGTTLRQRLDPHGGVDLSVLATDVPFRACVFGSLAGCLLWFRLPSKPQEATRRACVIARRFARDHPCPALCIAHASEKSRSVSL